MKYEFMIFSRHCILFLHFKPGMYLLLMRPHHGSHASYQYSAPQPETSSNPHSPEARNINKAVGCVRERAQTHSRSTSIAQVFQHLRNLLYMTHHTLPFLKLNERESTTHLWSGDILSRAQSFSYWYCKRISVYKDKKVSLSTCEHKIFFFCHFFCSCFWITHHHCEVIFYILA